jgi:hypothetical protein
MLSSIGVSYQVRGQQIGVTYFFFLRCLRFLLFNVS